MRVLGIDPGYATVGLGVVDYVGTRFSVVYYGAIVTQPNVSFDVRLEEIYDDTRAIIERVSPDAVSVEKLFFNTNQKTAIAVAQARGAIVLAVKKSGVPIFEYTPLQVKQAVVGYGRAEKLQVMDMTRRILGLEKICGYIGIRSGHGRACDSGYGKRGRSCSRCGYEQESRRQAVRRCRF